MRIKRNLFMTEVTEYRIQQIVDNGQIVQMTLAEDVLTEPASQKQMIMDSVAKKLDPEIQEQETPLLEAILQAQPTILVTRDRGLTVTTATLASRNPTVAGSAVGEKLEIN